MAECRSHRDAFYVRFASRHLSGETPRRQGLCAHLVTSLRTLVRIVEGGPTLEASNLPGLPAASAPYVVDHPLARENASEGVCSISEKSGGCCGVTSH